jgi:hypothetical protein
MGKLDSSLAQPRRGVHRFELSPDGHELLRSPVCVTADEGLTIVH